MASAGMSLAMCTVSSFFACSSNDPPGAGGNVVQEAGVVADGGPPIDAPVAPPGYDGGLGLGLADVADTPCVPRGGSLAVVLAGGGDASPAAPLFRSLQRAGDRRLADTADGSGFVLFDADGSNAKRVTAALPAGGTTALGGQIVRGGKAAVDVAAAQSYDLTGIPAGNPVTLANEAVDGLAIGADDQSALVVWATKNAVRGRGVTKGAAAGDGGYDLALGAIVNAPSMAVSSVKSGLFAVVFSGDDTGSRYQTAFGRGSATARIGDPSNLFTGAMPRSVVGLARTPAGFAVLVTVADGANPYAMLVLTDAGGHKTSAGLKLLGTREARGVAVNGSEIGVLAHRREGTAFESRSAVEFRAFDVAGAPLGPWVCLEPPGDETELGGGIVADGTGYAAIFRAADGSASLARFDRLGTGAL